MKAHGTYLVPTAYLIDWMQTYGKLPVFYQQKMHDVSAVEKQNAIRDQGWGEVALGTDAAVYPRIEPRDRRYFQPHRGSNAN